MIILLFVQCGSSSSSSGKFCSGDILIPFQEEKGEEWGFINVKGNVILKPEFDYQPSYAIDNIALIRNKKNKFQFIKINGDDYEEDENSYDVAEMFSNGLAAVRNKNEHVKFINTNFETVFVAKDAESIGSFSSGLVNFEDSDGNWGYMNKKGEIVIKASYDEASPFYGNYAYSVEYSEEGEKSTIIIDKSGEEILSLKDKYDVQFMSDDLIFVYDDGWGVLNLKGEKVIKPDDDNDMIYPFINGYCTFKEDGEWGLMNKKGEIILKPKFETPLFVYNDLISFRDDREWGIMNIDGEDIIDPEFDNIMFPFLCKNALVLDNKDVVAIDREGKEIKNGLDCENIAKFFDDYDDGAPFLDQRFGGPIPPLRNMYSDYFDYNLILNNTIDEKKLLSIFTASDAVKFLGLPDNDCFLVPSYKNIGSNFNSYSDFDNDYQYDEGRYKCVGKIFSSKSIDLNLYEYNEESADYEADGPEINYDYDEGDEYEKINYPDCDSWVSMDAPENVENIKIKIRCDKPIASTENLTYYNYTTGEDQELKTLSSFNKMIDNLSLKPNTNAKVNKIELRVNLFDKGYGKAYFLAKELGDRLTKASAFDEKDEYNNEVDKYELKLTNEKLALTLTHRSSYVRLIIRPVIK